jgi:hypothetical protein
MKAHAELYEAWMHTNSWACILCPVSLFSDKCLLHAAHIETEHIPRFVKLDWMAPCDHDLLRRGNIIKPSFLVDHSYLIKPVHKYVSIVAPRRIKWPVGSSPTGIVYCILMCPLVSRPEASQLRSSLTLFTSHLKFRSRSHHSHNGSSRLL